MMVIGALLVVLGLESATTILWAVGVLLLVVGFLLLDLSSPAHFDRSTLAGRAHAAPRGAARSIPPLTGPAVSPPPVTPGGARWCPKAGTTASRSASPSWAACAYRGATARQIPAGAVRARRSSTRARRV
jgi:hypothetical protein